jgi:thiamine pyrophosphokinase
VFALNPRIARAIIIANGTLAQPEVSRQQVAEWLAADPATLAVAANGGVHNALVIGLKPAVVIGDMDSLDEAARKQLAAEGCRFETAPSRKDETDLELALDYTLRRGARWIRVLGALGGRLDQTLANILLLTLPSLADVDARIVEGHQTAWLVRGETELQGAKGDIVSLIPLGGEARGVTSEGLDYVLADSTLAFGPSLGISNVLTGPLGRVSVREGLLLAVHTAGGT